MAQHTTIPAVLLHKLLAAKIWHPSPKINKWWRQCQKLNWFLLHILFILYTCCVCRSMQKPGNEKICKDPHRVQDGLILCQCYHPQPVTQVLQQRTVWEVGSSFIWCKQHLCFFQEKRELLSTRRSAADITKLFWGAQAIQHTGWIKNTASSHSFVT